MKRTIVLLCIAGITVLACTGCQESESIQIRRARVVANENIQLKKQLAEKDEQIEALKKDIEKIQLEAAQELENAGEANLKVLKLLLQSETANKALQTEIEKLKAEIEKLKAQ